MLETMLHHNPANPRNALWYELEASYTLRARLFCHEKRDSLDSIREELLRATIFEPSELELVHQGHDDPDPDVLEVHVLQARSLRERLEAWLQQLEQD
jgi:hypothetical protein